MGITTCIVVVAAIAAGTVIFKFIIDEINFMLKTKVMLKLVESLDDIIDSLLEGVVDIFDKINGEG